MYQCCRPLSCYGRRDTLFSYSSFSTTSPSCLPCLLIRPRAYSPLPSSFFLLHQVMSGSGDPEDYPQTPRPSDSARSHMASHMALGFLFLGGCRSAAPSQYFLYTPDNIIPWCIGVLFAMNVFFLAIQSRLFFSSSPDYAHSLLHLFLPLTFLTPNSLSSLSSLSFITLLVSLLLLFLFFSLLQLLSQSQQQGDSMSLLSRLSPPQ